MQFPAIKVGAMMMVKGRPCRIADVSRSAPGKHGHAKKRVIAYDLITNKKYEDSYNHHDHLTPVDIRRTVYEPVDVDNDGFVSLMTEDGDMREDLKLNNEEQREVEMGLEKGSEIKLTMMTVVYRVGDDEKQEERVERLEVK